MQSGRMSCIPLLEIINRSVLAHYKGIDHDGRVALRMNIPQLDELAMILNVRFIATGS